MFTRIFKPKGAIAQWLGPVHPHLYSLTLEGVPNPFDADAVWDEQYSGCKGVSNLEGETNNRWKRLRNALDEHRVMVPENDQAGRMLDKSMVYTDVVVWIAKQVWLNDMAAGAAHIKLLAYNLAKIHQRDFESSLYRARYPNYVVMPSNQLDLTQVRLQFGRGVFVPKTTDQWIAKLQFELLVRNYDLKDKRQIKPWMFFLDGSRRSERYMGLYKDQHSLLISIDSLLDPTVQSPFEFRQNDGYLLINQLENARWECFYLQDNQLMQLPSCPKDDGAYMFSYANGKLLTHNRPVRFTLHMSLRQLSQADVDQYVKMANIEIPRKTEQPKSITQQPNLHSLRSRSAITPQPYKKLIPAATLAENYAKFGVTIIPGKNTQALEYTHALVAEGVALPRIDSEYAISGLKSWSLWLDQNGNPVNNPDFNPQQTENVTSFSANNQSPQLFYRPNSVKYFLPVEHLPLKIPLQNSQIEMIRSPFAQWLAILQFANPFAYALEEGRYLIGRFNPEPDSQQADIQLDQLTHPHSLNWDSRATAHKATFTNLGLSRNHAWAEIRNSKLRVNLAQGHRVYSFNNVLREGKCIQADENQALELADGERILVGNYLLRFDCLMA